MIDIPYLDKALETVPRERLRGLQWERLTALAREVFPANPFVREMWKAAGIRSAADVRAWDDFARLPFTLKAELVADQVQFPPFGSNLTYPLERYIRVHQTSGTTGAPIRWLDTQDSWDWWARCWSFVLRGAGVTAADRVFFPFSFGLFVGFWGGFEGARAIGALAIPAGGQDSKTRLAWMETLGATVLVCTPSYALHLAEVAREMGIDPRAFGIRILFFSGEPGASIPTIRARIADLYGGLVFDSGSMAEISPWMNLG
ncbi:MAG: phenylacetate--CoA ligase family protein, partial [Candidatus Rokubacteria bacterium]|nr:phenylacetate--CoA ligase family protein [Candidatus Rokubacteria bacterium]